VNNDDVIEFARGYLTSLCAAPNTLLGHRIEAAELLQKHGSPKILQPIERPARTDSVEPEETRAELAERMRLRREYIERKSREIEADLSLKGPWSTN
jgi:hypothetical protein